MPSSFSRFCNGTSRHARHGFERFAQRIITFDDPSQPVDTPVFDHALLPPGSRLKGPAVIEGLDSTVLIPPAFIASVDASGTIHISRGGERT